MKQNGIESNGYKTFWHLANSGLKENAEENAEEKAKTLKTMNTNECT